MKPLAVFASAAATLMLALSCASAPPKSAPPAAVTASAPILAAGDPIARFLKPYAAASKACRDALEEAATLSSKGKWMSAFRAIDDFDKANADPFALAMKTSLVLRGAVRNDMDRAFGLADLEEGQELESLRNGEGDYEPLALDPPALADAQSAKGIVAPGILSKELGDYYFDVIGRFSGSWALSDQEILAMAVEHYSKAYAAGVFDGASLVRHAETLVRLDRGEESDLIYAKALELDPKDADALYSYALSLSYEGRRGEALSLADRAIDAYGDAPARLNAVALGARTAAELGDDARTQAYYAIADKDYPGTPTPGILRHMVSVKTGNEAAAEAAADALVSSFGSDPSVVRTMISSWYSAGKSADARDFLQRSIAKGGEDKTIGTLDFYFAVLLAQGSPSDAEKALGLKALDEAESRFKAALGPENDVYNVIAEIRSAFQAQAPSPGAGPGEGALR